MMPKRSIKLCAMTVLFLSVAIVSGQTQASSEQVFEPVPQQLRTGLSNRLSLLVQYERRQQWDRQFELLSRNATQGERKKAFVDRLRATSSSAGSYRLLNFSPKYTASIYEGRWQVFGCVETLRRGQTMSLNGEVAV